jgi:ribosomal protein S18 acetylase RimI-like enzyme
MRASIRDHRPADDSPVVELALRAWAPVFASLEVVLGREIFHRLHDDWRRDQMKAVRETLSGAARVWVAEAEVEAERRVVGFVAVTLNEERLIGEIAMLAVDPADQGHGVGIALTASATEWLRSSGMRVAVVETGGDAGHAPARALYEKAGYTLLPVARYFKPL